MQGENRTLATRVVFLDDPTGAHKRPEPTAPPRPDAGPSLTGSIVPHVGAKLLMDLFVDERTGRLVIEAAPAPTGTLFFLAGEPVHAQPLGGIAPAVEKRLEQRGGLADVASRPATRARTNPLTQLARRANPVAVLECLRDEVREFATQILTAQFGQFAFYEDSEFPDHTPLTNVNPFGFVLEAKRRALSPDAMLRLGEELAPLVPAPRAGFANVAPRLRQFTGAVDLSPIVDGTRTHAEIFALTRLDPLMGGLIFRTLADTGVIDLLTSPRAQSVRERRKAPTSTMPALVQTDSRQLSQLASLPGRGAEILSLYLEIKPERDPHAILGVDKTASAGAIERGYQQALAELDPRAIPMGANRPYLLGRAEELREKVERTYHALSAATNTDTGAYELGERLGEGGMAEVFKAHASDNPKKAVAIKRILPSLRDDAEFARQFIEEARLARRIQHPNVIEIYSVGKSGDDLYLAMELIDGLDLAELVRRSHALKRAVPWEIACRIVADACGGLHAAHTARDRAGNVSPILHRDVSTHNILVSKAGDVKLTDFGIAKALDQLGEDEGAVRGKIPYVAPEVLQQRVNSVRSDVYAMGMTLYATLAVLPFHRHVTVDTMKAILFEPLPHVTERRPDVPPVVDELLLRAAARNPEERHASAQALQLDLEEALVSNVDLDVGAWVRFLCSANVPPPPTTPAPKPE
jgi:serine/threonine protein kinase